MRILTFTTLYPSAVRPQHGIFIENRLRHLLAATAVEARVVAPCPWFPFDSPRFGDYALFARTPRQERRFGITVHHPRYPLLPRVSMNIAPYLIYLAAKPVLRRLLAEGYAFDLIDAHYFYPDGVAAVLLGRHFGRPVSITARGSDINVLPDHALPRRMISWAARHAAGLATVSQALKDKLVTLGVSADRVRVLRNGVDLDLFVPGDRTATRARLGIGGTMLLSVGNLVAIKGHDLVITALALLPDMQLLLAGAGPERPALEALAARLGVTDRVRFLGRVPHEELPALYGAADMLILASSHEGWPNVLLEAMACGTPVVASDVCGIPEIVSTPAAGLLLTQRTPQSLAATIRRLVSAPPERDATRRHAAKFDWSATTAGQLALFQEMLGAAPRSNGSHC